MYLSLRFGKFDELRNLQKLFVSSFIFRLKAVRDAIDYSSINYFDINSFVLTDSDRLLLVLNLKYCFFNCDIFSFLVLKKKSLSYFFEITDFYSSCLRILFSYLILPVLETISDRYSLDFRPFRDSHDVLYQLRSNFLGKTRSLCFFKSKFFLQFGLHDWFEKNFPFDNFIKKFFISNAVSVSEALNYNFYFVLVKFLLDGLV